MSIGTTAIIAGSIGLAGAGISAGVGLTAAGNQADAANNATAIQQQQSDKALNFQEQQWQQQQQNEAPWLQAGGQAINTLSGLIPQLNQAGANYPTFQAPTADQARQTPGYQFAQQQGQQAVDNSAAARGGLLSGNAVTAEQQYGQGLADSNYQQVYNNALQQYQQGYNQFQNQQNNEFNRYATLAGYGQTAAGQLGQQGQAAASNAGNIAINFGQQAGNNTQNAAYQNSSGYLGASNAITGGLNNLSQYAMLSQLKAGGGGANPYGNGPGQIDPESYPANYPY